MSRMEFWQGNLVKVSDNLLEFLCEKGLISEEDVERDDIGPADPEEVFHENFWKDYILLDGCVYQNEAVEDEYGDFQVMERVDEDTLRIVMSFYNGGTCLSEMCEDAYKKMEVK